LPDRRDKEVLSATHCLRLNKISVVISSISASPRKLIKSMHRRPAPLMTT
jgi:hypothetical protein